MPRQPYAFSGTAISAISWTEASFLWRGRLGRRRYLIFSLIDLFMTTTMLVIGIKLARLHLSIAGTVFILAALGFGLWSSIALVAKRLRDLDLPGWVAVPVIIIADTGGPLIPRLHEAGPFTWLCLLTIGLCLVLVRGSQGPNRYGRTPNSRF